MMPAMFHQGVMRSAGPTVMTRDRFPLPMDDHRLDALIVVRSRLLLAVHRKLQVVEVIAHPITRENIRGDHLRTQMPARVPHDKAEHAARLRPKIRPRHCDRQSRRPGRAAENKRVDAFRSGNAGVRQNPRPFFDDDARDGGASHEHDTQETSERIETHKIPFRNNCRRKRCSILEIGPPVISSDLCKSHRDSRKSGESKNL